MEKVLVLSYEEDPHADYVCKHLNEANVDTFRVHTDKLIGNYKITFDSQRGFYTIENGERKEVIDQNWNIWNRRVLDPEIPADMPKELCDIVLTETERTWEGLLFAHKGRVVNRPQANYNANNKVDQLLFVQRYGKGIVIPETLLTNDPSCLVAFYQKHPKISHKMQKAPIVKRNDEYFTVYNNIVGSEQIAHADLIVKNPSLFQEYIDKAYELRITATERKIIGIAIHSQLSQLSKIDFRRYDFDNVLYEKVDLPEHVTQFCSDLLQHYGLHFGEIDMIYTKDGKYVFLEINPNGQWLWLQLKSGYNLTKDVAENIL